MASARWAVEQCAAHCNVAPATWRQYAAEGRTPAPLPQRHSKTGRVYWDADEVIAWQPRRPGPGARSDLTYLHTPAGRRVYVGPHTTAAAVLLIDAPFHIDRAALVAPWPGTRQQLATALGVIEQLGAIVRHGRMVAITDRAALARIAEQPGSPGSRRRRRSRSRSPPESNSETSRSFQEGERTHVPGGREPRYETH